MTRKEHLLTILSEECAEVSQRVSKALRFGLHEVQPNQPWNNAERITQEIADLLGVYEMLCIEEIIPGAQDFYIQQKRQKVEKFLKLSEQEGTLKQISSDADLVESVTQWVAVSKHTPICYKTGDWDGKRSDLVIVKDVEGKYHLANRYEYFDGQFEWYDNEDYGLRHEVIQWKPIE